MARKTFGMSGSVKATLRAGRYLNAGPPPSDPAALLREAWRLFHSGRPGDAERLCRHLLEQRPDDAEGLHLLGILALQAGRLPEAAELIDRALAQAPANPDFMVNRGAVHMAAGEGTEGIACLRRALEARPGHGDAHLNLGMALIRNDRLDEAIEHLGEAARLMPKSGAAHVNLGAALAARDGPEAGLAHLRKAVELDGGDPLTRLNLGNALVDSDEPEEALAHFEAGLQRHRGFAALHFGRARALQLLHREKAAIGAYRQVLAIDAGHAGAHNNLSHLLIDREQLEAAEVHARQAVAARPDEVEFRLNLATVLAADDRADEAVAQCEIVEAQAPGLAEAHRKHAAILQEAGEFDRAREVIERLRGVDPDPVASFALLAPDRNHAFTDEEIARVESAVADESVPPNTRDGLCFALAAVFERLGRFDEAFAYLDKGNRLRNARTGGYDAAETENLVDRLIATFDADFFAARDGIGVADDRPLFVVGMPRSGTSLIEQIVASHRWAAGAGELGDFEILAENLPDMLNTAESYPACVGRLDSERLSALGNSYLRRLSARFPDARRITDKMPVNFMHLGVIALMFPRARVLHCARDPMDTCFSIFAHSFSGHIPYAYAQESVAHYFGQYRRLMAHWRAVLPIPMLDVGYEDLVAEPEARIREMIDFCGLEWDDDCLQFHEAQRTVRTASLWQVRQPIYRSSVGRWRNFEAYLGPLQAALNAGNGAARQDGPIPGDRR